ncbi:MAG: recombinase family protein [Desulfobulbaceae bacterium]|nr:recombinase family protein [Desulfobulbaceae bacterium]
MLVGYARVSTLEQSLNLQVEALKKTGCDKIYEEVVSGIKAERKILNESLSYLRPGDTLVVWRLDRLGRSMKQLIELINMLKEKEVGFKSIVEAVDTTTPTGQFFFHITGAFAEFERNLIRERTMAGLASARARGRKGGRPKALDQETFQMALVLYNEKNITVADICKRFTLSKRTFYRYLEEHRAGETGDSIG